MLSLAAPLWLLGLLGLPVIWWLYRLSQRPHLHRVSAAWLWPKVASSAGEVLVKPASDPRWWLRVAICTLFLVALSGLGAHLITQRPISVWLDDSLSMQTLEHGQTRQALALRELRKQLGEARANQVTIRALSDHSARVTVDSLAAAQWQASVQNFPIGDSPALPEFLDPDRDHWLVTDGADPSLLGSGQFSNVLRVGTVRTNTALTQVSVRPGLQHPEGPLVGVFTATAFTDKPITRTLRIQADGAQVATQTLTLANGELHGQFELPRETQRLNLNLEPADQLPADDHLVLELSDLNPVLLDIGPKCGSGLRNALSANPMLRLLTNVRTQDQAALIVNCDDSTSLTVAAEINPSAMGQLLVHRNGSSRAISEPYRWYADAAEFNRLFLNGPMFSTGNYAGSGQTLLSAGQSRLPLIVREGLITHVFVDLENPATVNDPAYPYLVTAIAQLTVAKNLVNPQSQASRNAAQSRVAPAGDATILMATSTAERTIELDLTRVILSLLIALVLLDALKATSTISSVAQWFRTLPPTKASHP
jgi:hypothetical protein